MKEALLKRVHREFMEVLESIDEGRIHHDGDDFHEILRDIEAALEQPAQREPLIAFRHGCKWCGELNGCEHKQPPQRTWVDLKPEDRLCAKYMLDAPEGIEAVIDYITAKLKELNT